MSYISREQAKACGYCGGSGMVNFKYPRPCPKCHRQCYGEKPPQELVLKPTQKLTPDQEQQVDKLLGDRT